jgi:hypothetical protein
MMCRRVRHDFSRLDAIDVGSNITSIEQGGHDGNADRHGSHRSSRHLFNPADAAAVAEAEERFKMLTGAGYVAAKRTGTGTSELIRKFDPTAEETLFIPWLQGG